MATHELIIRRYGEGKVVFVRMDVTVVGDVENSVRKAVEVGGRLNV